MFFMEISGPEFLSWYAFFFGLSVLAAWAVRSCIFYVSKNRVSDGAIDQYDIAYLSGGREQVFLTSIGTLVQSGVLNLDPVTRILTSKESANVRSLHPVERRIYDIAKRTGTSVEDAHKLFDPTVDNIRNCLVRLGLAPSPERVFWAQFLSAATILALPLLLGFPRLMHGIANGRPVGFLALMLGGSGAAALIALFRKCSRTSLGSAALRILKKENGPLKANFSTCTRSLDKDDMALAYALFGGSLIAGTYALTDPFNMARAAMKPQLASGGSCGSGSGCGSSCGSSCGGGCGGGGCGG